MPPSDLTRFDFHVVRFMNSYDVEIMTDAEIGQYILLLCKSWLLAHDATLPDDIEYLSRIARTAKVSERVLAKFPMVDTNTYGRVRRNQALFEEWEKASERSEVARDRVARRSDRSPTVVLTTEPTAVEPQNDLSGYPYHTIPTHTKPNQSTQPSASVVVSSSKSDWKNIALRHKRIFGSKASVQFRDKYYEACAKYGEDVVLQCFDEWAPGAKDWVDANNVQNPLYSFFKKLPAEAEDAVEIVVAEKQEIAAAVEKKQQQVAAEEKSVAIQNREIIEQFAVKPQTNTAVIDEDFFKE